MATKKTGDIGLSAEEQANIDAEAQAIAQAAAEQAAAREADLQAAVAEVQADKEYIAVHGGPMIDPDTGISFTSVPVPSQLTGWLSFQLENKKITEANQEIEE